MARRRPPADLRVDLAVEIGDQAARWVDAAMDLYKALAEHARCGSYRVVVDWHEGRPRVARVLARGE